MADVNQRLLEQLLQVRLPDVDDVVDVRSAAEIRMIALAAFGARRPQRSRRQRLLAEDVVVKVLAEQPELPELIRDVLANVGDDAVGPDDDLFALLAFGIVA